MNEKIVLTAADKDFSFYIDVEVPLNEPAQKICDDMIDTLNAYRNDLGLKRGRLSLWHPRKQQYLSGNQTLSELGVWNGDFIILVKEEHCE